MLIGVGTEEGELHCGCPHKYLIKWRMEDSKRDSFFYLYSKGHVGRLTWERRKTLTMTENWKVISNHAWHKPLLWYVYQVPVKFLI